jgi:oligoribonuclease
MAKKLADSKQDKILWIDLEMTGLSPVDDLILEVAAIVTDWDFKEIATFQGIIRNKVSDIKERMLENTLFWVANTESKEGLLKQNASGKSLSKIESDLVKFINTHFIKAVPILLCGNSIHMDRRFIISKWPKLDAKLHYRMLDVSAWKVVFEGKFKKKFTKPDTHRALDDIRGSIMELKYYLSKLK